jgi:hypothetical protein
MSEEQDERDTTEEESEEIGGRGDLDVGEESSTGRKGIRSFS